MTLRREKRNNDIRDEFDRLRTTGVKVADALDAIADAEALEPDTVRKIIYDKNYGKRNRPRCMEFSMA